MTQAWALRIEESSILPLLIGSPEIMSDRSLICGSPDPAIRTGEMHLACGSSNQNHFYVIPRKSLTQVNRSVLSVAPV